MNRKEPPRLTDEKPPINKYKLMNTNCNSDKLSIDKKPLKKTLKSNKADKNLKLIANNNNGVSEKLPATQQKLIRNIECIKRSNSLRMSLQSVPCTAITPKSGNQDAPANASELKKEIRTNKKLNKDDLQPCNFKSLEEIQHEIDKYRAELNSSDKFFTGNVLQKEFLNRTIEGTMNWQQERATFQQLQEVNPEFQPVNDVKETDCTFENMQTCLQKYYLEPTDKTEPINIFEIFDKLRASPETLPAILETSPSNTKTDEGGAKNNITYVIKSCKCKEYKEYCLKTIPEKSEEDNSEPQSLSEINIADIVPVVPVVPLIDIFHCNTCKRRSNKVDINNRKNKSCEDTEDQNIITLDNIGNIKNGEYTKTSIKKVIKHKNDENIGNINYDSVAVANDKTNDSNAQMNLIVQHMPNIEIQRGLILQKVLKMDIKAETPNHYTVNHNVGFVELFHKDGKKQPIDSSREEVKENKVIDENPSLFIERQNSSEVGRRKCKCHSNKIKPDKKVTDDYITKQSTELSEPQEKNDKAESIQFGQKIEAQKMKSKLNEVESLVIDKKSLNLQQKIGDKKLSGRSRRTENLGIIKEMCCKCLKKIQSGENTPEKNTNSYCCDSEHSDLTGSELIDNFCDLGNTCCRCRFNSSGGSTPKKKKRCVQFDHTVVNYSESQGCSYKKLENEDNKYDLSCSCQKRKATMDFNKELVQKLQNVYSKPKHHRIKNQRMCYCNNKGAIPKKNKTMNFEKLCQTYNNNNKIMKRSYTKEEFSNKREDFGSDKNDNYQTKQGDFGKLDDKELCCYCVKKDISRNIDSKFKPNISISCQTSNDTIKEGIYDATEGDEEDFMGKIINICNVIKNSMVKVKEHDLVLNKYLNSDQKNDGAKIIKTKSTKNVFIDTETRLNEKEKLIELKSDSEEHIEWRESVDYKTRYEMKLPNKIDEDNSDTSAGSKIAGYNFLFSKEGEPINRKSLKEVAEFETYRTLSRVHNHSDILTNENRSKKLETLSLASQYDYLPKTENRKDDLSYDLVLVRDTSLQVSIDSTDKLKRIDFHIDDIQDPRKNEINPNDNTSEKSEEIDTEININVPIENVSIENVPIENVHYPKIVSNTREYHDLSRGQRRYEEPEHFYELIEDNSDDDKDLLTNLNDLPKEIKSPSENEDSDSKKKLGGNFLGDTNLINCRTDLNKFKVNNNPFGDNLESVNYNPPSLKFKFRPKYFSSDSDDFDMHRGVSESLSEGEIPCKCSVSSGELHICDDRHILKRRVPNNTSGYSDNQIRSVSRNFSPGMVCTASSSIL